MNFTTCKAPYLSHKDTSACSVRGESSYVVILRACSNVICSSVQYSNCFDDINAMMYSNKRQCINVICDSLPIS